MTSIPLAIIEREDAGSSPELGATRSNNFESEREVLDGTGVTEASHLFSLPPVDSGWRAWSFLVASFVVETIVYGFPSSFGVFLEEYLRDPTYSSQQSANTLLPMIGTLSAGVMYCSSLIINPVIQRYPYYARHLMFVGAALCFVALFSASYTTRITSLVALQGVLYSIGGSFLYYPCIMYGSEWFVKRRGFANGVISAGTAAGGLIFPLFLPYLIELHGAAKALRYLSFITTAPLVPCLFCVKGRLPESTSRIRGPEPRGLANVGSNTAATSVVQQRDWLKDASFWAMMITNTLQAFAYFVPVLWLPTFTTALKINPKKASLALAFLNGSSVFGRIFLGHLADIFNPWLLSFLVLVLSSLSTFIVWGVLSYTFAGVVAFGITYGAFAGSYTSLWIGCMKSMTREDHRLTTILIGYLMVFRGIGNIVSTPIASALSANSTGVQGGDIKSGFEVDGGRYEKTIVYVGTCFAGAAVISMMGWFAEQRQKSRRSGALVQ